MTMSQSDVNADEELNLAKQASQNPNAILPLYDRYVDRIYRYFLARTGGRYIAEDLTSQLFLRVMQKLKSQPPTTHFASWWLFVIARNLLADHYRSGQQEDRLDRTLQPQSSSSNPERLVDEKLMLKQVIRKLSADDQELLNLRYAGGLSFAEIGALRGITAEAAKTALYRLQQRLRDTLEKDNERD